jgi:phosphoenolpyruvate carboxykinase (ATP)
MPIQATRALLHAALSGRLEGVEYRVDESFGFEVPLSVPGVDQALLDPRSTWSDPTAYDEQARNLAAMFRKNFEKFPDAGEDAVSAGPTAR